MPLYDAHDDFPGESQLMAGSKVVRGYLPIVIVGVFLGALLSSVETFLTWGHKNVAVLAISRWALSSSRCSDVAVDYLRLAEMHLAATGEGPATRSAQLQERVAHFQFLCEEDPPFEGVCSFPFEACSLPYNEFGQTLPDFPAWTLTAYWVDEAAVELGEHVQVVLKWTVAEAETLNKVPEQQVRKVRGISGTEWRFWREGNAITQAGKVKNLVPNGGFELNFLPSGAPPSGYFAGSHSDAVSDFFYLDVSNQGAAPTTVGCLKAQAGFYAGLYVLIPVAEFEPEALLLQGARLRTVGPATASVGGAWETPEQRFWEWAALRVETGKHWTSYAQVATRPENAYQFSFRVANWGDAGTSCFDDVFVLPVDHPAELLEALW